MSFPTVRFLLLGCLALAPVAGRTQTPAAIPEIEVLRAPYLKNLATIRAAAEARTQPVTSIYLAGLQRLAADASSTEAANAERERVTAKRTPTAAERQAMTPAVAALRTRYEQDLARTLAPFELQEAQQTRQYVSALDTAQRRLVAQNQIQKAAAVTAERTAVGGVAAVRERTDKTVAESTIRAAGKLDAALSDKIAAAVTAKTVTKTITSSTTQEGWSDTPDEGALLVGFEIMELQGSKGPWVRSLRPYFMNRDAIVPGKDRGKMETVSAKVMARPGYAVAGLLSSDVNQGLQVIFMKIDPATGRFDPNSSSAYKSKWFGTKGRDRPLQIGGDGRLVVGVHGKTGADCDTIGLVQLP